MTNLDSILKSRDITLPTKVHLVKAMVFPVVMYGCESWTIKKAEHWRIDAFELWCWRRLLKVPWSAIRSNPLQYSCLENPMDGGAWKAVVHAVAEGRMRLSIFTFTFHLHALEKEMAAHSGVLAWRIPGTGEPGGLLSVGSHRVGNDWSDLAAVAVVVHPKGNQSWIFIGRTDAEAETPILWPPDVKRP